MKRYRRYWLTVTACMAVGMLATVSTMLVLRRPAGRPLPDAHDVPLGVEEAVVIRYSGPHLVARPYRRGASVSVRISEEAQAETTRVYDVRYVVNLPGEFDLKDYLTAADGSSTSGLPSFKIRGLTSLTKDIETRIHEIEDVGIQIWHGYYETLLGLGGLWVLWLFGLLWIGRPKRAPPPPPPAPAPSLAEQIAGYLEACGRGELSVAEKARLEILLLKHWREQLASREARMAAACRRIQRHDSLGPAYEVLEAWLHAPTAVIETTEVLRLCAPVPSVP